MKRKTSKTRGIATLTITVAMCITMLSANGQTSVWDGTHTTWTQGNGTQSNPYLIENAAQLAEIATVVNNGIDAVNHVTGANTYWKLMTDIDLDSLPWTPIGYYTSNTDYYSFGGNIDGNGHTISKLFINTSSLQRIGLFAYTDGATIVNLGINSGSVDKTKNHSTTYAGGIVGYAYSTTFTDCFNNADVFPSDYYSTYSGGIAGYVEGTTVISNCYNTGKISSYTETTVNSSHSGGIVGYVKGTVTTISNCYNKGQISASTSYAGGIVGYTEAGTNITECYNTGRVSSSAKDGSPRSGGIVGVATSSTIRNCYNRGIISASNTSYTIGVSGGIAGSCSGTTTITNCYNAGDIASSNDSRKGGIAGAASPASVTNSYYLNTCGGDGSNGGEAKLETSMKEDAFVDLLNTGNTSPVWSRDSVIPVNNGFPILVWQLSTTSIKEIVSSELNAIVVYPNPVQDVVRFSGLSGNEDISISDISGRTIYRCKSDGATEMQIPVNSLASGMYFVRITNKTVVRTVKIVKQ
jgi:hypothetical protein